MAAGIVAGPAAATGTLRIDGATARPRYHLRRVRRLPIFRLEFFAAVGGFILSRWCQLNRAHIIVLEHPRMPETPEEKPLLDFPGNSGIGEVRMVVPTGCSGWPSEPSGRLCTWLVGLQLSRCE